MNTTSPTAPPAPPIPEEPPAAAVRAAGEHFTTRQLEYRPQPGDYGLCAGGGAAGAIIRHATESPFGHAVLYIGQGLIVEGTSPKARVAAATSHRDAVWSSWENPTAAQRQLIVAAAVHEEGTPYDWAAYVGFALEVLHIRTGKQLAPVYAHDPWRVCSALVAAAWSAAGYDLTEGLTYPNLVSPADLAARAYRPARPADGNPS